jgi:hypothetical protein
MVGLDCIIFNSRASSLSENDNEPWLNNFCKIYFSGPALSGVPIFKTITSAIAASFTKLV